MGAIYWVAMGADDEWRSLYGGEYYVRDFLDGAFVVKSGNLGFSVVVFCVCATNCMVLLFIRRVTGCGELGGNDIIKYATSTFFVFSWFVYVGLSSWYALKDG